jgi:hypothetical protein
MLEVNVGIEVLQPPRKARVEVRLSLSIRGGLFRHVPLLFTDG